MRRLNSLIKYIEAYIAHRNFVYITPWISAPAFVHHGAPTFYEVKIKLLNAKLLAGQIGLSPSK